MIRKFHSYTDDITGDKITCIVGYDVTMDLKARIFSQRVKVNRLDTQLRHFPQINDDANEQVYTIGDTRTGYKSMKDAKTILISCLDELEQTGSIK